jgi:hypothetical protein
MFQPIRTDQNRIRDGRGNSPVPKGPVTTATNDAATPQTVNARSDRFRSDGSFNFTKREIVVLQSVRSDNQNRRMPAWLKMGI